MYRHLVVLDAQVADPDIGACGRCVVRIQHLVLSGMPLGSPGMELSDGRSEPYTVELVADDGTFTAFARH